MTEYEQGSVVSLDHSFAGQEMLSLKQLLRLRPPTVPFQRGKATWINYMSRGLKVDGVFFKLPCLRVGSRGDRMTSVQAIRAWVEAMDNA